MFEFVLLLFECYCYCLIGVGFDLFEFGYLLMKFVCVFEKVCVFGLKFVVYVGEEGLFVYIYEVFDVLKVDWIDYGVCSIEDVVFVECFV